MLAALGQLDFGLATQRRHLDRAAQRRSDHRHRHRAVQVVAIALEDVVLLDPDLDVEIAARPAVDAGLAIARGADAHALVDAGRDLDLQRLGLLDLALAVAGHAGVGNDLAAAVAVRAGLLDAEEALAHVHRAGAAAGAAGLGAGAGLGTGAAAGLAAFPARDADLRFLAAGSFLERDFHRVAEVAATVDLLAGRTAPRTGSPAEDVSKDVAEGLREAAKAFRTGATPPGAHVGVDAGMAVLVIGRALLRVGQHLVGLLGLLELLLGLLRPVALVAVGVVLHRQLAVSLLDVVFRRVLGDAEDFVVIAFGGHPDPLSKAKARARHAVPGWVRAGLTCCP
mmetsp:Transcript_8074/g.15670  ORF Transcript_8074/g.15670 Transcript_8074/m.15670 type:complete len:339 (-) Transcript_8074:288-1304(-)